MKIENLRSERKGNRARVAASVRWEDCDRPTQEVYFETEEEFAHGLTCNPNAFLSGCMVPALHHGEKRISIDAEICPELRDGLITAMNWIRLWYYGAERRLVRIEAKLQSSRPTSRTPERAGFFFSGGIDSLATLRANRLNFPLGHPGSFKDALIIYGQNIESDNCPETFEQAVTALSGVAKDAGITLIPVYTNIRYLDEDHAFFFRFHGAILAATAHAFARRLSVVSISASDHIPALSLLNRQQLKPHGSHPLLDPNYSSSDLRIRHDGITLSRLDKTKLVVDWDLALQNIKVCQPNWPGKNCGRCEKCVRTMLALLAVGALDKTNAFPLDDISEDQVSKIRTKKPTTRNDYTVEDDYIELIAPLAVRGRHDLVRAIEHLIARSRYREKALTATIKRFDRKYLNGNLVRFKRLVCS